MPCVQLKITQGVDMTQGADMTETTQLVDTKEEQRVVDVARR